MYTLAEAAKAVRKSKSTILRAVHSGKVSAQKDAHGQYQITADELHRVYPTAPGDAVRDASPDALRTSDAPPSEAAEISVLQAKLEAAEQLAKERQSTIDDLRDRLDKEGEERRKLTALLTDQRSMPEAPRGFLGRLWGRRS